MCLQIIQVECRGWVAEVRGGSRIRESVLRKLQRIIRFRDNRDRMNSKQRKRIRNCLKNNSAVCSLGDWQECNPIREGDAFREGRGQGM